VEFPWAVFRKAALVLFGISLLAGFGATALYMRHRLPLETWRIVFILALVVLTITSTILIPGVLLPNITSPHSEFLADDLSDEWQELQRRTVTRPHLLMLAGAISALVYVWCLFYYGKVTDAIWFGWMPVGVAAICLALLLFAFVRRTDWYHNRFYRTPSWVMFIAFAGFATAQFLGIYMTEQVVAPQSGQLTVSTENNVDYGYVGSRAYYITRQYLTFGPTPDITVPDCDGDECAYVFLAMLLVLLTVVLVVGAALIPHMWVLSCLVLLTLIALLVLHEVRRDRGLQVRYGRSIRTSEPGSWRV
jgi:MFS family permease